MSIPAKKIERYQWLVEEMGLQLIRLQRGKKEPLRGEKIAGAVKRSFEEMRIVRNDNAGVLTGRISGVIVLDIDDDKLFPPEYEMPETFTVRTKKGYHHYFRLPNDGKKYGNRAIKHDGFDIRGEGGYVVAPWSVHPEAGSYTLTNNIAFADAPVWLLDLSESSKPASGNTGAKAVTLTSIVRPPGFKFPPIRKEAIEKSIPQGRRSEGIWAVLNELVELGCTDKEIIYTFESHPEGIGQKYFEKGGNRAAWLTTQIEKIRELQKERLVERMEANDQTSVGKLTGDIVGSLRGYGVSVTRSHEESVRDFVNLLIGLLEGSVSGWYAIPIPVGGGKTLTLMHFAKFLYEEGLDFPLSIAFEKVSEIESAAEWLEANGVPTSYFQKVHHEVEGLKDILLQSFPILLHTHQRLTGASYVDNYFTYQDNLRRLLIYDESMLNALVHSSLTADISTEITRFTREYGLNDNLKRAVPEVIYSFLKSFNDLLEKTETKFRKGDGREIPLEPDVSLLGNLDHKMIISYARIIEGHMGATDLYKDILLAASAPAKYRKLSMVKEAKKPAILVAKELLDERVENLITTDASRGFRRLFKYSQRSDGKQVKLYNISNFRWDDELGVWGIPMNSGRDSIKKAFNHDPKNNEYLEEIAKIVEKHNTLNRTYHEHGGREKSHYLFFYPKILNVIPALVELKLIKAGLMAPDETDERLFFANFGRETATNEFKDCDVIIFIGLNHKPKHTLKALLAGEGFLGDLGAVLKDVEIGEFLQQLQQGIGRGTIRKGLEQFVYFFHRDPEIFRDSLQKAFPLCYFNGKEPRSLDDPYEEGLLDGEVEAKFESVHAGLSSKTGTTL